ncbi:hypothetical protein PAP_07650 [Palaeococcus pacificus DY20341]|uniref:Streptomycin 3''-adenylyltransferase n=1 Tax=Palaeococcus pacificus DY20341 TaxID=1343739 RepID=A0A075LU68_9EURY|nr:aminoglycoside adenylyltransferase domain-containing protein [Palaeococcus pacificus]AIF69919.1 hypothetical protein PAP_07650 [Palaeococcus pacificus DY20341]
MEKVKDGLEKALKEFKEILSKNLVGIYLHGSLAMGCFVPGYSDVDLIIVVKTPMSLEDKKALARVCLEVSKEIGGKGLEMSVILEKYAKNPPYPIPFEFHYSEWFREAYERGEIPFESGELDPDLSAHLKVLKERGVALSGKPIEEVFGEVTDEHFIKALLYDVKDEASLNPPEYLVLNICRMLYYLREKKIASKVEGGTWALKNLPMRFRRTIEKALLRYQNNQDVDLEKEELLEFREFALSAVQDSKKF